MKRFLALFFALIMLLCFSGCNKSGSSSSEAEVIKAQTTEYFSDGDFKDVTGETVSATITLSGDTGTISDTTLGSSGKNVTITSKGIYKVTGSSENVTITVNDTKESGNIYIILDSVTMENSTTPCILVEKADKVIIQTVGENSLTYTASSGEYDGAIYSKDDITVNGSGTLNIDSSLHGIVGTDDVKVTGSTLNITSKSIGIKANDSVRFTLSNTTINSSHDGIQVDSDEGTGFFYMEDGTLKVSAYYDGIDVKTESEDSSEYILIAGGEIDLTAGGGSDNSKSSTSEKCIKCDGDIKIGDAEIEVSSADDALHAAGDVVIAGGEITLSSSDDGIHAEMNVKISSGNLEITKSYEGIEGAVVDISGGNIKVYASDDGINAAGGSDTQSDEQNPSFWGSSSTGTLNVSGGNLYVNANGDGLDSNGSMYISGGAIIVEGPTNNGNGALDKGDGNGCVLEITGGTVLAIGSSGMAINFDSGSQCSALVSVSGNAGDTITVNDGSGFSFTATKSFSSVCYSSPSLKSGSSYSISVGSSSVNIDFSSGKYYSTVSGMGGMGGMGGQKGNMPWFR